MSSPPLPVMLHARLHLQYAPAARSRGFPGYGTIVKTGDVPHVYLILREQPLRSPAWNTASALSYLSLHHPKLSPL